MRLHRLWLTAFGSFPGDEEVDFDALGEAGLFLVHGPTGAGKTTVLDAVCYALYGQVPGQRNSARRLRCDHAPPDRGPKVALEVTVRGRRLRVTRSPVWNRPKLRGEGLVEEKAKALLEEWQPSGEWRFLTGRADEAGELIGGLLGMNADQFCQVAMLPQGDFARFLRADGDERRKLLEKLFSVKIFSDVEHWLADHRTRTGQERQELRQRVDSVTDHMRGAAGPALLASLDEPGTPDHADEPLAWAQALLAAARDAVTGRAAAKAASEAALRSARVELEGAHALVQRQRGHADAVARRDELDRAADERSDLETILAEAARADRVLPLIHQSEQRAEASAKADGLAADAMARALPLLPTVRNGGPGSSDEPERLGSGPSAEHERGGSGSSAGMERAGPGLVAGLERERRDEIARLEQLRPEEARLAGVREELGRAAKRLVTLAEQEAATAERLAVLPELRRATGERLAQARLAASGLPAARAAVAAAGRDLAAVQRRDGLADELAAAQRDLREALFPLPGPPLAFAPEMGTSGADDGLGDAVREAARETCERLAVLERAHRDELAVLEHRRADEARHTEVKARLAGLDDRLAELADREAALADAQAELPVRLAEIDGGLAALRADLTLVPAAEAAGQAANALLEQARRRDALAVELEAAEGERRLVTDEAQELRDRLQSIRQARIDGMAAELAGGLVPGEACAVCGSPEHPAPASPADTTPTVDHERAAQERSDQAQEARQEAERRVAVLSAQLGEATGQAGGLSVAAALASRQEAEAELTHLGALARQEPALAARAESVRRELDTVRSTAQELELAVAEHRARRAEARDQVERLAAVLDAARDGDVSVSARRERVTREARLLDLAIQAATRVGDAASAYTEARDGVRRDHLARTPSLEGVDPGVEEVEAVLVAAELALGRLREAAGEEGALAEEVRLVEAELAELTEGSTRIGLEVAAERARERSLAADAERLTSVLAAAVGDDATLAARLERLTDEAQLLHDAVEAGRLARSAGAERDAAGLGAENAATDAGFANVADARAAARTTAAREAMAERLRGLDAERAAVTRLLGDPELVAAAALPAPDVAALTGAFDAAEHEHATHASARDQAGARYDQLQALSGTLEATLADWRPAEERHRLARRLAELAVGTSADNRFNMRLSSYVLGERLRQVVDAANQRLDHMSGGRYLLLHNMRKSAADRKRSGGGLGLYVLDGWTGAERDPATLSGGEAFMTSLALALALADVVTDEAGGVELGTLFIDEGFGTLDEESLDAVLDILDELRDGGRAVGIVSHVGELRARVPAQLKVVKNRFGSSLSVAVPG
ncbi:AAA family ATPase [Sphaerisporangium corydalis]|uniref:Nuclease SbcCD subunit C n=1 Tax=Sphaerisporangium corydalis TaxID=1441875 RepID=A0ABV9E7N3_9ACTN|nr:AAA family ATPase [Sphaerisporangium corydalis]